MRNSLINFHTRAAGGDSNPAESSQASALNVSTKDPIAAERSSRSTTLEVTRDSRQGQQKYPAKVIANTVGGR